MEKIFTCIKNIGVWHSFEKMKLQLCFFLKKTFSSLYIPNDKPKPRRWLNLEGWTRNGVKYDFQNILF